MNFRKRSYKKELLDKDNIPFEDIKRNMQELNFINTWLGGHSITIKGLRQLIKNKKQISICEIGCGGGDNLYAIKKWCDKKSIQVHCIGIDIKKECIDFAKEKNSLPNAKWICNDYLETALNQKPDIIFSSLFCHHFTDDELVLQLQWMKENSTIGFFINDLQRHQLAYYLIKILTKIFSSSYLVKNDAPLSVARGFTKKEWENIFANTTVTSHTIQWRWAFRYLIVSANE